METFVQVNTWSQKARVQPIGYIVRESGCWEWTGHIGKGGYGTLRDGRKQWRGGAHRWMYEQARGPIPAGLDIDHLCKNRKCVNPDHLEAVTPAENCLRGGGWGAQNKRKSHCIHGHAFDRVVPHEGGGLRRRCTTCERAAWQRFKARRRAERQERSSCFVRGSDGEL